MAVPDSSLCRSGTSFRPGKIVAVETSPRRFMKPEDAAEMLTISSAQMYALLRRGEIRAIKLGGRGQWRVEVAEIEAYIERMYAETEAWVRAHPFAESDAQVNVEPDAEG